MLTVTDSSHQSPSKLGSDLVPKDVVGIANRRLLAVSIPNAGTQLIDFATGGAEPITPTVLYPIYNADVAITDIPAA